MMNNYLIKSCFVLLLLSMNLMEANAQLENLNPMEKMLVKKWQVTRTVYEMELVNIPPETAPIFAFSADYKWKKEIMEPKLVYHGTWSVDTAKQVIFITWEEKFDTNTYQYKIKKLTEQELIIEPMNANTETVYYRVKE